MQDFWKGGVTRKGSEREGSEREARAEILATPPQQLVIDTWKPQSMRILMLIQQFFAKFTCSQAEDFLIGYLAY